MKKPKREPGLTGAFPLRIRHYPKRNKRDPFYRVRCGCCPNYIDVYHNGGTLEIEGVLGSVEELRKLLNPLLKKRP